MTTSAGGSSNLYGISYQLLWSLLKASEIVFDEINEGDLESTTTRWIVVEPFGGGGDLQLVDGGQVTVQQLKAKSDGATWSFRSFALEVLPDLYKALDRYPDAIFQLVTEGRMGDWQDVKDFLNSFKEASSTDPSGNVLELLDNIKPIRFNGFIEARGPDEPYPTSKQLFVQLARILKSHEPASAEDDGTIYLRLFRLLRQLEFQWKQRLVDVRAKLRDGVLALIEQQEGTDEKIDAMVGKLQRIGSSGEKRIDALQFWREAGLRGIPLDRWDLIRTSSRNHIERAIEVRGYSRELDVRKNWLNGALDLWHHGTPSTQIYGAEPENADDTRQSLASGKRLNTGIGSTIADGLMAPTPGALTFPINQGLLDGVVVASDDDTISAMRFLLERQKLLIEPSGAVALAAIIRSAHLFKGKTTAVILSGGNIDLERFSTLLT